MLSITTDYLRDVGSPEPYLRRIAEAGFTHVHWCHHWNDDFLYADAEIEQIGRWLDELGLKLNDLHASAGHEKRWISPVEYERLAGVELVRNRIDMTSRLGGDVIILHMPAAPNAESHQQQFRDTLHRSLDALQPAAQEFGVRIALENLTNGNFRTIHQLLEEYPADYLGVCYDSGHGNITGDGLDHLDLVKDRLISLHLHDNDGKEDSHQPLFSGTVDWERLARLIGRSSYDKMVSLEVQIHHSGIEDEVDFLTTAREGGERFAQMIEDARG